MQCNRPGVSGVAALMLLLVAVSPALARKATVTTNDGRQFTGEVDAENEKGIKLFISGISTLISRDDIRDVKYELTVIEQYEQRRAKLKDDDLDGRYKLAYWLNEMKSYDLAQRELADLATRFPSDGRIKSLQELVANRIKLRKTPPKKPMPSKPVAPKPDPATKQPTKPGSKSPKDNYNRLTKEQINLIKVYEIDLGLSREPRIVIPRDVVNEFLEEYADKDKSLRGKKAQQNFRRDSGAKQLKKMFKLKAREYYGRAEVREDPAAMGFFKKSVHRSYVLNYCGTTKCHGGPNAGEFELIPFRQTSDETVYTNFFMINRWERGEGYMIDRDKPEKSYLYQYGLPRTDAKFPHPNVKGWKANLIGRSNTNRRNLLDWINQLYRPAPEYPITFDLHPSKTEESGSAEAAAKPPPEPEKPVQ